VQVRHDDGVANHIGPEPCVVIREGDGEPPVGGHRPAIESRKDFPALTQLSAAFQ
jgi:hypothetical protein